MKKAELLLASLLAVSFITSCSSNPTSSSSSVTPTISSSVAPTPTSSTSIVTPTTSSSTGGSIQHRSDFVSEIAEGAVLRDYKSQFDTMVNDFSSDTFVGETTGTKLEKSALKVLVDSETDSFPGDTDATIYKMATGNYQLQTYDTINFRMRVVEGKLDYSNLVLALRGDDAYNCYEIDLSTALNNDSDPLPELGNEFVDVCISPNASIEDGDTEYTLKDSTEKSGVKVLSKFIGFHLYAKGECSAVIELEEVSISLAGEKTVLDNFNRTNVNKADDTCWWRGSTGFIVRKGVSLKDGQTYKTPNLEVGENTELVLSVLGDTTGTSIAPVTANGVGTPIKWSDLKDKDGGQVASAVNGAYYNLAINLEKSGLAQEGVVGYEISSTSEVAISEIFLSSLKEKEAATSYPLLDTANAKVFDSFSRSQERLDTTYDDSVNNEKVTGSNLNFSICYSGVEDVSVDGDALVFAPTANYTQVTEGTKNARTNEKYLVLSMKVENGTLDNLRIQGSNSGQVVYANNWYAGEGLKSIPADPASYPYVDADGYTFYIIDLELSGMGEMTDIINIFYTGEGTLKIDSIFFANDYLNLSKVDGPHEEKVITLNGYVYGNGIAVTTNTRYLELVLQGDGEATFNSLRLEGSDGAKYCRDNSWYLKDGTEINGETVVSTEKTAYIIDLVASGFTSFEGTIHLHCGEENQPGSMTLFEMNRYDVVDYEETLGGYNGSNADLSGYAYLGGADIKADAKYLVITLSSTSEATLASLRFENSGTLYWFFMSTVKDAEGNAISPETVIPAEGLTLTIDLNATGIDTESPFTLHLHSGAAYDSTGDIKVESAKVIYQHYPYSMLLNNYVENPTK